MDLEKFIRVRKEKIRLVQRNLRRMSEKGKEPHTTLLDQLRKLKKNVHKLEMKHKGT